MVITNRDEDGLVNEPCLSCKNLYFEDIWGDPMCDTDDCPYGKPNEERG